MNLAVNGCDGRMGRALVRLILDAPDLSLAGGLVSSRGAARGTDLGVLAGGAPIGVGVTDDPAALPDDTDGVIDFSTPAATAALAHVTGRKGLVHVVGTTGLSAQEEGAVEAAAARTPVVMSPNMSVGVCLLEDLARRAAVAAGEEWDVEIVDMHHAGKRDAPSGTARLLARAVSQARGGDAHDAAYVADRALRTGPRDPGTIGVAVLRGGSVVGDHDVVLAGPGEILRLSHRAESRDIFARGALRAARWAAGRPPGLYSMRHVLGREGDSGAGA